MQDFAGKDRNLDARSSTSVLKTAQNNHQNTNLFPKMAKVSRDAYVSTSVFGMFGSTFSTEFI